MEQEQPITKENMKEYLLSQIDGIKQCAKAYDLKFLASYLELAKEILIEELQQKID